MMILITVVLFSLGIILCITKEHTKTKPICNEETAGKRDRKLPSIKRIKLFFLSESFHEYIITIIATILGVTLAIICTNCDSNENNRKKTIEFLGILDTELLAKERLIDELALESLEVSPEIVNDSSLSSPILSLEVILTNDPYSSTLSSYTYGALLDNRTAISACQNRIINNSSVEEKVFNLSMISSHIAFTRQIIKIELLYQNNEIDKEKLIEEGEKLYYSRALNVYGQIFGSQ